MVYLKYSLKRGERRQGREGRCRGSRTRCAQFDLRFGKVKATVGKLRGGGKRSFGGGPLGSYIRAGFETPTKIVITLSICHHHPMIPSDHHHPLRLAPTPDCSIPAPLVIARGDLNDLIYDVLAFLAKSQLRLPSSTRWGHPFLARPTDPISAEPSTNARSGPGNIYPRNRRHCQKPSCLLSPTTIDLLTSTLL